MRNLRIQQERYLVIFSEYLSPKIGCGAMLASIPPYSNIVGLFEAFRNYGITKIYADKSAAKILEKEEITGPFCSNAIINKAPLKANFKVTFFNQNLYLVIDEFTQAAYFLGDTNNKLSILNYYRDAMPGLLKKLALTLRGAFLKLTPYGWQNLYELLTSDLLKSYRKIEVIEIGSVVRGAVVVNSSLRLEIGLLNFSDLEKLKAQIISALQNAK